VILFHAVILEIIKRKLRINCLKNKIGQWMDTLLLQDDFTICTLFFKWDKEIYFNAKHTFLPREKFLSSGSQTVLADYVTKI